MKTQRCFQTMLKLFVAGLSLILVNTVIAGSFTYTGTMHTTRDHHTATLLPNGKVLVAGGYRSTSAELFDPGNGTWSVTGSLTFARQFHTATLLPNGKVLVAGGEDGYNGHPASAELFDPGTGTWSVTGSLAFPRTFHTSTLLPNGKVLVTGGGGFGNLTSAELYDPATGTWSITGSLSTARASHTATLLPNGKVLVAGGSSQSDIYNVFFPTSTELYDPATGSWSASGNLNLGLASHTATLLSDGKVLVAGGYGIYSTSRDAESYDPATGSWSDAGGLATSREYHTATLLPNGKVLLTGGRGYSGVLDSAELYDPASGSSSLTDSLATTREFHTATLLLNGKVLIAGGNNLDNSLASAELFNPNPVTQPPFIVTQPQTRTNNIGTTATFKVVVSGNEPLSFQWRKEGTNLVNNGNTSGVTTTNLTISNVQFTNAGNYTVVITNSFGGMTSSVAVLVVTLSPDALALANALDNTSFAWSNSGVANWFAQTNVTHDGVDAVQSGEVGQFQSSTLSTTVVGPGTLSFWSRASSSSTNHVFTYVNYLDFFLNGIHEARTPGYFQYGWQQQTFYLPAGSNLLSWVYSNNNSSTNGNAGWLDEVIFVPGGTAPFGVGVSYDRVPSWRGGLATFDAWTTGGTPPFVYQLFKNGDMVTSGDSSLLTLTNVQLSDAASTFSIRVTNDYGATILSNLSLYLTPIAYWGDNSAGQRHPPEGLSGVVKVSAGMYHSLALQANGTVAGWGDPYAAEVPMGLTNVVDIAAGEYHNLALLANGTVVAWGDNWAGQSDVPPSLNNVAAVAAGAGFSAALRANGTVVCWGEYDDGESLVLMTAPAGLNNITSIAAGYGHCLALRSNGTVVAWGDNAVGQTNVPTSLSNVVALAAG
ncbi:MAG TPA: kelch repeat-containing protein, partial [Verrucomicrobiota bacterium]|nr:kelch repeat-containing protein [Verrucomicrobiota bacterium]